MIAGVFLVSIDFTHVKTALHLKKIIFQQILAKVGAVVYEYYKNAFVERCEKETLRLSSSTLVRLTKAISSCLDVNIGTIPKNKKVSLNTQQQKDKITSNSHTTIFTEVFISLPSIAYILSLVY